MNNHYVKFLDDVTKEDFILVGGKGANLGEMLQAELPVPGGFVVLTTAYNEFIKVNNLQHRIDQLLEGIEETEFTKIEKASEQIKEAIYQSKMPEEVQNQITTVYQHLGQPEVTIRSSATAEDLPGLSFAGQYNSYLNVKGVEEVLHYVKQCWASLWNARAVAYRMKHHIDNDKLAHGVIVQQLVHAEKSGILFTTNPVNGRRDQILINASFGLAELYVICNNETYQKIMGL